MTHDQLIDTLAKSKRTKVAKATGFSVMYLYKVEKGLIKDPGFTRMDKLREVLKRGPLQ